MRTTTAIHRLAQWLLLGALATLASAAYGQPPRTCHSCFQQCYIEPSLMQARPLLLAWEWLHYPAVRRGNLGTYAPG